MKARSDGDAGGTSYALDRIVATLMGEDGSTGEVERIEAELAKVRETVAALTASIDLRTWPCSTTG